VEELHQLRLGWRAPVQNGVLVDEGNKLALSGCVRRFHSDTTSKASMVDMNRTIS
jgi:hypothetical protein